MKRILYILLVTLLFNCSSSDDGPKLPTKAVLTSPENNQECTTGIDVIGTNKSSVTFKWEASSNTNSYDLVLKNLNTQSTTTHNATTNELTLDIDKGTPYSWYIISKSESVSDTAISETWKFYNAGDPVSTYTPFPADMLAPNMGANFTGISTVNLSWNGSDIDNDILNYDVYLDTVTPPVALISNTASTNTDATVTSGNTYYWRIVTNDSQGNSSQSEISQFTVN